MSRVSVTKLTPEILSLPLQKLAECVSVHSTFSFLFLLTHPFRFAYRLRKPLSCMILTRVNPVGLGS